MLLYIESGFLCLLDESIFGNGLGQHLGEVLLGSEVAIIGRRVVSNQSDVVLVVIGTGFRINFPNDVKHLVSQNDDLMARSLFPIITIRGLTRFIVLGTTNSSFINNLGENDRNIVFNLDSSHLEDDQRNVTIEQLHNIEETALDILCHGAPTGGTLRTVEFCRKHSRPYWIDDPDTPNETDRGLEVCYWIEAEFGERPVVLNVAGPRESKCPGIQESARRYVARLLAADGHANA